MPDYLNKNGETYTEQELIGYAEEEGLTLEEYMSTKTFEAVDPGKTNDFSTETQTTESDDMEFGSDDGSLEQPSWGSQLRRNFDPKGSIMPDLYTKQKREEEIKISEEKRKSTKEHSNDKKSFEINLNAIFKNPNTLKEILSDDETLQNISVGKGGQPVRNPEEGLKDYFHEQIKGFGWISNGQRNIDPNTGESYYPNLTNRDIDELIDNVFDKQFHQEKVNTRNDRININEFPNGNERESRAADINTFDKPNQVIANLVEQINHGGLKANEIEDKYDQLIELKKKQGKTDMLFNYNTGQLILPKSKEELEDLLKQDGVKPLQDKSGDYQGLTLEELKTEYKRSSLAMGGLNKQLGEIRTWEVDNPAYAVLDSKEKIGTKMPKRIEVTKSVRDFLTEGYSNVKGLDGQTDEEWNQEKERLRDDKIEYTADHEALKRMYLLNDGLLDIKKSGVETAVKSFIEPFIGRYGTDAIMGGQSERIILDKVGEKYGELGIPIDKKEEKYLERDLAETVNEGLFGSGRILAEFYAVGKFLKPIEYATGLARYTKYLTSSRYRNISGKSLSEATIKSRASANGLSVTNYTKRAGLTKVDPTIGMQAKSLGIAGLMEGAKFEAISRFDTGGEEGGFATGFGFGVAGRMIAPLAPYLAKKGYLKDIDFKRVPAFTGPLTKRVYTPGNLSGQALFQQFVSAPASFVAGSEAGEIMHGIVDDAFGNKQYSQFMDEHYGDYGEVGKRMISNYFIGIGFGMAGPHGSMFKGFADFKSETGIRKTRDIAYNNAREILNKDAAIPYTEIAEANWRSAEMQQKVIDRLSKKKYQEWQKHAEVYHGMNGKLLQLQRAKGYMDPLQSRDMIEKDMQHIIDSNKKAGIETKVEVIHNNNLKPGQKKMTVDADVVVDGKTRIYKFNAETYTPDVKAHEVSHDFFETQFEKDAIFKGEFISKLNGIAKKIETQRFLTEEQAKIIGAPNRAGKRMNLSEAITLEKNMGEFDGNSVINNQRISQWELFSHIAQQIGTKANYLKVKNSDGYMQLGKLIKDIGKKNNQKYNLSLESDVVRWFRDYSKNVKKGVDTRPMFAELESVVDYGATMQQRINMRAESIRDRVERGYESKDIDVDAQKNRFLDNQRESLEAVREGGRERPLYAVDKFVFDNEGNRKYETLEQFKANESDYWGAWEKIFGEEGVFDAKIAEGMRTKNPDIDLVQFEADVKDLLLTRFQRNFDPAEAGGSLFGYFENTAVPYEKLRVQERYFEGKDIKYAKPIVGEKGEVMQIPAGPDVRMEKFETENIMESQLREMRAKKEGKEVEVVSEEGRVFSEMMGRDKSGVQAKINEATKKQKIDLDKTKPIYKTLKKWLTEVEKVERDGKKVKPTKEADVRPLGVLSEVMKIVSAEYGVPLNRLLANQTLSGPMRKAARDYIKNKVTEIREGVFPEGETPSGIATGVANTSWKGLYDFKGKRGEFKKGKTAAGKEVVEKRTDITDAEILEKVGIKPDGTYAKGTSFDSAIKELIKFDATIEAKQALTTLGRDVFSNSVIGEMGAGRPEGMASKNLEGQGFADQVNFLFEVQGKTFEKMFKRNLANIEDPTKAINKTLVDYFTDYKAKGNEFNISGADLRTIGKELNKEYKFTKITPTKIASKAAKAIELPNSLKNIDIQAGLEPTPFTIKTLSDLVEARAATRVVTKALVEKHGDGIYEQLLMRGESGGKGVGAFGNIGDIAIGKDKGRNRVSLHENSEAAIDYMSDIVNSKGKRYGGFSKTLTTGQGDKAGQMNRLIDKKTGEWNTKALNEAYKVGEFNKTVLKDAVDALRKAYEKGDITHTQARQWVEIHGSPMTGLIKLAGSFAVVPNMSVKQMYKKYGKNASDYVLEHTTPAQYVKARIYDYIINGEAKKSAMDLTLKDYHTTLIPEKMDVMVNKTLQTDLPSWHLPGMDPIASRYYEANHPSDFGFGLRNFKTGKVYDHNPNLTDIQKQKLGKQLGEINNKLFPKGLKKAAEGKLNSKNLEDLKNISKALELGRKKDKVTKGGSFWDLDDTLFRTKSGVRYTLPNPSGKPAPGKKVIFMAGGPGSGKSTIIKGLKLKEQGFKVVNQDISLEWLMKNHGLPKDMKDFTPEQASKFSELGFDASIIAKRKQTKFQGKGDGIVVDGTGNKLQEMQNQVREFKNKGYDVKMMFVETSLETALKRNQTRKERSLRNDVVKRTHESVQKNKEAFKELFGDNFAEVKTDNLKQGDPMPKDVISKMDAYTKGYKKGRFTAEEFANEGERILAEGGKFDFTEFDYIREGTEGPLFNKAMEKAKKFGTKDTYILTARPHAAKIPIFRFLEAQGLKIPFENIITLENSAPEAKALKIAEKIGEGYNDIYFADDVLKNVQAVKNIMEQFDIKGKVQQALASKDLNKDVNNIMESTFGIESKKKFSTAEGKVRGKDKKRRKFFMTDSAADLELLIEPMYGKGKKGVENKKWFEKEFLKPWERGINDLNTARQTILNDYMSLRKNNKDVVKSLSEAVEGTNFTADQAARVYIWNKAGFEAPGLTKTSKAKLLEHVANNPKLQAYAESVAKLTKIETGLKKPKDTWYAETIASEVSETGRTVNRDKYIGEWIERKNEIFSKENMAKMESELGPKWRESVENMFYRMETGTTRTRDLGRIGNEVMNYLNGSVGAIMNLNTRSATLQLISSVNFINHAENNPLAAAKAFANQPQYWKDFMRIMNSDMLKQRRDGLQINVTEAELAAAVDGKGSKAKRAIAYILKQGYIPTKIADSFAISSGGATYYRNRAKMYQKQGLSLKEAEAKAFIDFQAIAERTQQSSRPDLLSQQQTSFEGRLLLPFANTPMQMNRIMMKEMLDLSKGRYEGSFGENSFTNKASKVAYYGFVQSAIFAGLQTGLFALMANSDDEDQIAQKKVRAYNTMADSFLRGMGIPGVVVSGVKNAGFKFYEQNQKGFAADYSEVGEALLNMSPTIGSKFSKLDAAGNTYAFNKKEIQEKGFSLDNTKALEASATVIEAVTNIPIARVIRKTENIQGALDEQNEAWQRWMMGLGWSGWDVGATDYQKKQEEKKTKEKQKFGTKKFKTKTFKRKEFSR